MNIENYVETKYRELLLNLNTEFIDLYTWFKYPKLEEVLATLHFIIINSFKKMNERLPTKEYTAHFWADPSRELLKAIDLSIGLQQALKSSTYSFNIDPYYIKLFTDSRKFLCTSLGSEIPPHMDKVELYFTSPIFVTNNPITVVSGLDKINFELKPIGEGSYANVYKYKDTFYQKWFVLKRAKKDLDNKELIRFKREFEQMKEFHSPYIVDVHRFNDTSNEYIMEFMDCSLYQYIEKNNSKLTKPQRKSLLNQVLKAFQYIHSKSLLHRDISPKNVLIKLYDDVPVVKVADFGLVKIPNSDLTSINTEFKGYFNDPALILEGFDNYAIVHETYALTRLIYFIMTGKTNMDSINNTNLKIFLEKGMSSNKQQRFQSIFELTEAVKYF
ncbi:protein kinase family protein [Acetobacterium bakii]|uniref:Serine/threonine protein kinase n=1 Tax=Acetobacterium bakii TaxID=52689 RepID=A0A0L6U007_9FIRM|nr:protein kinase family protein [Acetobacterium bakii]KNZ41682.1 serine/threonine protein kinase [Acetobacterium bakii]